MTTPTSVWRGSFTVFGVEMHCHVLDDGQRVIEADDVKRLFEAMEKGTSVDVGEFDAFARWQAGLEWRSS